MKIKRRLPKKIKILLAVIAVLVLAGAGYGLYAYTSSKKPNDSSSPSNINKVNSSPATKEQVDAGTEAKRQTVENNESATKPSASDSPSSPEIAVTITSANQNGTSVAIRSLITGSISAGASCALTVTNGAASTAKTAAIQSLASSATCQGFDIPVSELGSGTWNIQLTVTSGTQSTAASTTLAVK